MDLCRLFSSHHQNDYHDCVDEFYDLDPLWSRYNYDSCILDYRFDCRVNKLHKNSLCPPRIVLPSLNVLPATVHRLWREWMRLTVKFGRQHWLIGLCLCLCSLFPILLDLEDVTGFQICRIMFPTNANLIGSPVVDNNSFGQCISFDKKISYNRQFAWQIEISADMQ